MRNILVVDDNRFIVEGCRLFLGKECGGYGILTAANGREAMDIIRTQPVDAVLTDLQMPGVDGYELIEFIRRSYPAVLLFVMTGDHSPATVNRLSALGVQWSLEKPFSFEEMAFRIGGDLRAAAPGRGVQAQAPVLH